MQRRFRLTRSTDFQQARRRGKSYAHPLVVLIVAVSDHPFPRVGLVVGRSLGNAVQRNRAKRRLRAALRPFLDRMKPGYDFVLLARVGLLDTPFAEIQSALQELLQRAGLLSTDGHGLPAE